MSACRRHRRHAGARRRRRTRGSTARGGRGAHPRRHRPDRRAGRDARRDGPLRLGKTTLLNCLSGLDEIDGGRVLVDGQDAQATSDGRRTTHRARHALAATAVPAGRAARITPALALRIAE